MLNEQPSTTNLAMNGQLNNKTKKDGPRLNSVLLDVLALGVLLVVSRLVPHWPNVTALGAVAILAPRWGRSNALVILLPVIAMLIADGMIGFHNTMLFTYLAVFVVSIVSALFKDQELNKSSQVVGWGLAASVLFYLITNLGAWLMLPMYSKTVSGLLLSYRNGLPFFGYEIVGNIVYLALAVILRQLWVSHIQSQKTIS
jgi:hypothetical protein